MDEDTIILDYSSLTDFAAELERSPEAVQPFAVQAMQNSVAVVQDGVATYPPETAANEPGRVDRHGKPMGYYERGKGWWRPLIRPTTVLAHGTMTGGKYGKSLGRGIYPTNGQGGVMGYKLEPTSEQLGKSWTSDVQTVDAGGVIGTVGTNTSYADRVQGAGQTSVFQSIGWPAVRQVIEAKADEIVGFFSAALDDYLSYLVKK